MKKILSVALIAMFMLTAVADSDFRLFAEFMGTKGINQEDAAKIFQKMPDSEKVVVISIIAAKNDGDIDSLPPLKKEYEEIVNGTPGTVNLMNEFFGTSERGHYQPSYSNYDSYNNNNYNSGNYYNGAKWYFNNDRVNINFDRNRRIESISVSWTDNRKNASVKLIADGYTIADRDVATEGSETIYLKRTVINELFFLVRNDPVYIYSIDVRYSNDYYNGGSSAEYGYDLVKRINIYNNIEYIDINNTISDFKIRINQGSVYVTRIYINTDGREYALDVNRDYYAGSEYAHNLYQPMRVNYLRVEWNSYNRADVSVFVKKGYSSNPVPGGYDWDVPSYVSVNHMKVSSQYEADNTYSYSEEISPSTSLGKKVVDTLTDELRMGNNITADEREALRALARGNFIIRRMSSNSFNVIWW